MEYVSIGRPKNLESVKLVFGVDGSDGGAVFETSIEDDFMEWRVIHASVDPSAGGKIYTWTD